MISMRTSLRRGSTTLSAARNFSGARARGCHFRHGTVPSRAHLPSRIRAGTRKRATHHAVGDWPELALSDLTGSTGAAEERDPMRIRCLMLLSALTAIVGLRSLPAEAGCGCAKPPPPLQLVRPSLRLARRRRHALPARQQVRRVRGQDRRQEGQEERRLEARSRATARSSGRSSYRRRRCRWDRPRSK